MTAPSPAREQPARRDAFPHHLAITTRWADMDIYGHVNNVVFYSFFDTAVNEYLMSRGVLDPQTSRVIGLVVETRCIYFRSLSVPEPVSAGVRVARLGGSSVRYEIGIFQGAPDTACAQGHFVHVYVDRDTRRPVPLPDDLRAALARLA
ncbi:acyl-CoA thioesterase [Aquabacter spiritensis]|uniref:Acyl-CoA thioester hydrolase n=1 Tax=Aquabacter spiritensis TaxID=933073 RepID=A0A4V2UY50_9HYPH|nr:thioesterase family protein [Aquabacter spiritensis]TCT06028.1 acyl-CoA thioester hydrolase [Aquabacter spiritensis]